MIRPFVFDPHTYLPGCMNRGGHAGIAGGIDDRFTSFSVQQLKKLGFEGGKMMYRAQTSQHLDEMAALT